MHIFKKGDANMEINFQYGNKFLLPNISIITDLHTDKYPLISSNHPGREFQESVFQPWDMDILTPTKS